MQEQSLFIAALEKEDAVERAAFLDQACAGEPELRQRLDRLLEQHRRAGGFLETPAVPCVAAAIEALAGSGDTEPPEGEPDDQALDFLLPADQPDVLGRLGHYQVLEVVGKGGMGIVLRAFDEKLRRVVAIKVMAPALAANATARRRFGREAQAAAAVRNDHVIGIHTVEEASVPPYLVMEFISGQSLQERLDQTGALGLKEILRIGMQTALGLAAAHQQGLIHRDVKPANILLENGVERVKITDFGMARAAADASLTQCGVVAGTPQYMSPEQARGEPVDARTDLFSLGSVLYAMGTGRAPFRASGSLAVLKRVCEETPTPIREANPEVPDWLAAIIAKLHAKDPAERFQSAAEVAELLGRHLAQVQQPSVVEPASGGRQPPVGTGVSLATGGLRPPLAKRRWAIAAVVLLCLLGGLSLTEAAGVTSLRATVIRIFTPDGTLVVEVDDPGVKVTIEGDGGLVITGAGLEEIRLRPGSYKIQADKDGKRVPLERDLVSIAKGGREVVRVKVEAAPAAAAKADKGAFVVLGAKGVPERKFDTLADAVQGASDGDTIEVRGNGPFLSEPISIQRTALTIRAGAGFRPVIKLSPEAIQHKDALLKSTAALVLEGLELHREPWGDPGSSWPYVLHIHEAPLRAANCRFRSKVWATHSPVCVFRNCEFLSSDGNLGAQHPPGTRASFDNCLFWATWGGINLRYDPAALHDIAIQVERSTFVTGLQPFRLPLQSPLPAGNPPQAPQPIRLEVSDCIFDALNALCFEQSRTFLDKRAVLEPAEAEATLLGLLRWRGERNLFAPGSTSVLWSADQKTQPPHGPTSLADWRRFWGVEETGSLEGRVRFQGGDLRARVAADLDRLTPDDFRIRADSPGYRAGKDGKDLGADVDLVGPGPAYERWKQTPEYQQWLKDTGQFKAEAPKPEPKAFVLMGGTGVAERQFDTLAEAVQGASDGDTIEIRGNGPFVSQPITIEKHALVIRAGEGFRPVIKLSPEGARANAPLLTTSSALVLEGLDLWRESPPETPVYKQFVLSRNARLHVSNCRFLVPRLSCIWVVGSPLCVVRNCEFLNFGGSAVGGSQSSGGQWIIDNCLQAANRSLVYSSEDPNPHGGSIQLTRSSSVAEYGVWHALSKVSALPEAGQAVKPIRLEVSEMILDANAVLLFNQDYRFLSAAPPLQPAEAEAVLVRLLDWQGRGNLYGDHFLAWCVGSKRIPPHGPQSLADWKQFWKSSETGSLQGRVRYQGGDLLSRVAATPETITPEDFRLRPDSPGYRAGKDGKDLGADVDLVGPGPAYERWKKTPEYQQWLKDTGQSTRGQQ